MGFGLVAEVERIGTETYQLGEGPLSEGPSQPIRSGRDGVLRGNRVIESLLPRPFGCTRPDIIGPPLCVLAAWRAPSMSSAKESPARGGAWVRMIGCRRASPPPCHAFGEPGSPFGLPRSRHERRGRAPQTDPLLCNLNPQQARRTRRSIESATVAHALIVKYLADPCRYRPHE